MKLNLSISTGYRQKLVQNQYFSQKQIQGVQILEMDSQQLKIFLESEYQSNPLLEYQENSYITPEKNGSAEVERDRDPLNYYHDEVNDLKEFLKSQLNPFQEDELQIKIFLIECLDDNGFFTQSIGTLSSWLKKPTELVERCLNELKELEPMGVFSQNVEEFLLYQIERAHVKTDVIRDMILYHLDDIANGSFKKIAQDLHTSTKQITEYVEYIRTLTPYPAQGFGISEKEYVIPDVILRRTDQWDIELNDSWTGNYFISDYYVQLIRETQDEELKVYLTNKLERVQWIIWSIEHRRTTIKNIVQEILKEQKDFFEIGGELCPMAMKTIAEKLDIHLSTVSRAIRNKYLEYPKGTILMKNLFSQNVNNNLETEKVNSCVVKKKIRELISNESCKAPYSDQILKNMLEQHGIMVSRRTVAKYREELGIQSSYERKRMPVNTE